MSTLPFLLSVADELDNINSQSYMDDFGLGFHPHRQYYRTPTIQLSLPAGTDWMQHDRQQRYRSHHKFYDESIQEAAADDDDNGGGSNENFEDKMERYRTTISNEPTTAAATCSSSSSGRNKYLISSDHTKGAGVSSAGGGLLITNSSSSSSRSGNITAIKERISSKNDNDHYSTNDHDDDHDGDDDDDDDNIDNSVRMYNLSKKCCKNYHCHAIETNAKANRPCDSAAAVAAGSSSSNASGNVGSYRLHSKCLEGNNSSSDESLQKGTSSIEFLTCFLLKRSRTSSSSSSSKNLTGAGGAGGAGVNSKKS